MVRLRLDPRPGLTPLSLYRDSVGNESSTTKTFVYERVARARHVTLNRDRRPAMTY